MLLLLLACAPEPPPPSPAPSRPDVLLVTIDTLRADRVGAYGDDKAATPVIDALASRGVLFREAHATAPLTLPSHVSLFTGLSPARHGLRDNAGFRLADEARTLAEALQDGGWSTGAFVSAYVLDRAWGLDQGFQTWHAPFHPADVAADAFGEAELPSAETINAACAWWGRTSGPRFAWVHLFDPHAPWVEHPGWQGDPYRGEVAFADTALSRLVRQVGDQAWIVLASDHGEGLWDHGEREHGVLLGRSVTRVPLIVRPPRGLASDGRAVAPRAGASASRRPEGVDASLDLTPVPDAPRAARVVEEPVSLIDVAPTLLDALGLPPLPEAEGRSLAPALRGEALAPRAVTAETFYPTFHLGWAGMTMAQDATWRVELGAWVGLYDWTADPAGNQPSRDASGQAALVEAATAARGEALPTPGALSAEQASALTALGYLTEAAPAPQTDADPRDQIGQLTELRAAAVDPDKARAIRRLRALLELQPGSVDARLTLSLLLAGQGDLPGALAEVEAALSVAPHHPQALFNAASLAQQLGRPEDALRYARLMQAINPADPRGWRLETAVHVLQKRPGEVIRAGGRGLQAAPDDPNLHYLVGLAEIEAGDPTRAYEHFQAAAAGGSRATDLPLWTAYALDRAGRIDEAIPWYDKATAAMPSDARPWGLAGVMLAGAGRCDEARRYLINLSRRGGGSDPKVAEAMKTCGLAR